MPALVRKREGWVWEQRKGHLQLRTFASQERRSIWLKDAAPGRSCVRKDELSDWTKAGAFHRGHATSITQSWGKGNVYAQNEKPHPLVTWRNPWSRYFVWLLLQPCPSQKLKTIMKLAARSSQNRVLSSSESWGRKQCLLRLEKSSPNCTRESCAKKVFIRSPIGMIYIITSEITGSVQIWQQREPQTNCLGKHLSAETCDVSTSCFIPLSHS